jgi:hypothetical protein
MKNEYTIAMRFNEGQPKPFELQLLQNTEEDDENKTCHVAWTHFYFEHLGDMSHFGNLLYLNIYELASHTSLVVEDHIPESMRGKG